jgi:hypothetical protein
MQNQIYDSQLFHVENRDRIAQILKKYNGFISLGVGIKEKNNSLTDILCYRVYVTKKLQKDKLTKSQLIPEKIEQFLTDVIEMGKYDEIADSSKQRPLKGGVQIKNEQFTGNDLRGVGTLGCIAVLNDGSNKLVGLTNEHVVRLNPADTIIGREIGQPRKVVCCCCCTYNIIGKVLNAQKNANVDCAIIELDSDIVSDVNTSGTKREILEIGQINGTDVVEVFAKVKKRGAATGLTMGTIVDVAFDGNQMLIAPDAPFTKFADFGDSGSVIVGNTFNKIVGLLWAAKRDGRAEGVATPIADVMTAMNITIPGPPPVVATITVDASDTKTHIIPSILPAGPDVMQHFVTAKGTGDIVLKASFDVPVDNAQIHWFSLDPGAPITWPAIGTDNSTAKISRNTANGIRTLVALFVNGEVAKQMRVWVVWSVGSSTASRPIVATLNPGSISITGGYDFEFVIEPASIIPDNPATDDVPDLRGANTVNVPDVSDVGTDVSGIGDNLSTGADKKWDVTRRVKRKIINPSAIPFSTFPEYAGTSIELFTTRLNYPSNLLVGNDDRGVGDENNDPYTGAVKRITSLDDPLFFINNTRGVVNDTFQKILHFQEFARLEIGNAWYNISAPISWRIHMKYKKVSEVTDNTDYNGDGDKVDVLWIDDGSSIALDNTGF